MLSKPSAIFCVIFSLAPPYQLFYGLPSENKSLYKVMS